MKWSQLFIASAVSAALTTGVISSSPAFAQSGAQEQLIDDQYIVRLNPSVLLGPINEVVADILNTIGGGELLHVYDDTILGFSARLSELQVFLLNALPGVVEIEQDRVFTASDLQNNAPWGLDRVDQRNLPLNGQYSYPQGGGAGTHIYVIDTGINGDHQDFGGRVGNGINYIRAGFFFGSVDPNDWDDCNGHGTHVASTAAGSTYGVAKNATVHAVRVLDCNGSGSGSDILAGMEWVIDNAQYPAVANMSLGTVGGRSSSQEQAARAMFDAGILPVVAAGNDSTNACSTSPSAEPLAFTVGATDRNDNEASYSNFGSCVDIYAPGSSIVAASHSNNTGTRTLSGTSMATPHVAGAAALILAANPTMSPAALSSTLESDSSTGKVRNIGSGSPNKLLFVNPNNDGTPVDNAPVASFTSDCNLLDCSFDASASSDDNGIASYEWNLGNGEQRSGEQINYSYGQAGQYLVTLTVTDTAGQQHAAQQVVTVSDNSAPCSNCSRYDGSLSGTGASATYSYNGTVSGRLQAWLRTEGNADFNIQLQQYTRFWFWGSWSTVASSNSAGGDEHIDYQAGSGTYRWVVESANGSGNYSLWID